MIKVYYDGNIFYRQRHGGISVVFSEIFKRIGRNRDFECLCTFPSDNICADVRDIRKAIIPKTRPHRYFPHVWNVFSCAYAFLFRPDIFHSTYYSSPCGGRPTRNVLTIHDMICELFPEEFSGEDNGEFVKLKRDLAHNADAIVCYSESTKGDVLRIYEDIPPEKVYVIHNGVDESFCQPVSHQQKEEFRRISGLTKPFFLYVGRLNNLYKNFQLLLEVYTSTPELYERCDLAVVSADRFDEQQMALINGHPERVKRFAGLDAHQLKLVYACCHALVYPSKHEGFGIPILEAMACGAPVLAAGVSSLPEVGGDAALYFDPRSKDELRECMLQVCDNNGSRADLVSRGYENLTRFSWDRAVRQLEQIYKGLVAGQPGSQK